MTTQKCVVLKLEVCRNLLSLMTFFRKSICNESFFVSIFNVMIFFNEGQLLWKVFCFIFIVMACNWWSTCGESLFIEHNICSVSFHFISGITMSGVQTS